MSVSGRIITHGKIEPRKAFWIEEAVNRDDLAASNREPHHGERPPVDHGDNPCGAIDERSMQNSERLRRCERRTRHFARSTANERKCTALFPAV
jgi:hypothetical protein